MLQAEVWRGSLGPQGAHKDRHLQREGAPLGRAERKSSHGVVWSLACSHLPVSNQRREVVVGLQESLLSGRGCLKSRSALRGAGGYSLWRPHGWAGGQLIP